MATMNVDSEKMTKMASFVASAAPKLEKLAANEAALSKAAPVWVDSLIAQGLLKKEARDNAISEIVEGGIDKISEVVEYLISNVGPSQSGQPAEKRASAVTAEKGKRQSDVAWERALLGN
jgi:hypothetical protein